MGTGSFEVALDIKMLKDAIVDHRLLMQYMLVAQIDGGMTPGQVAMARILRSGRMGCLRATRPLQLSRLLYRMVKMQSISRIWHSDKVLWEQEGCHLQDLTTALAHRTPIHPHRRVLFHNHRLEVPRHRLGRLHM